MSAPSRIPRIAVLVETSTSWGAQIVQGIAQYARDHGPWSLFVEPRGVSERLQLPERWQGSGVIARLTTRQLAHQIASSGLPCVNVAWSRVPGARVARVTPEDTAIGQLAAQHLIEQGYRHFAYFNLGYQPYYRDQIGPSFVRVVAEHGFCCAVYSSGAVTWTRPPSLSDLPDLDRWLAGLPKPVGILAWDSRHGRFLTEVCGLSNLIVPDDVGIIICQNDDVLCETTTPPLSSVDAAPMQVGYKAAALLSQMIDGSAPATSQIRVAPVGVTTRGSTCPAALDDPLVADALKFIRRHAHRAISVGDVLAEVTVSRRSLELRFAKVLGRSPAEEIRRAHLHHAMNLLSQTDLPIHQISAASGFNYNIVMNRVFQREVGMTPSDYRRQARPRRSSPCDPRNENMDERVEALRLRKKFRKKRNLLS
jgi:LacI family transcriptional regulator